MTRVALVSTRPETVRDDVVRMLALADMGPIAGDLSLLMAPAPVGPTPVGGSTPWSMAGIADAREPGAEVMLCAPPNQQPTPWSHDAARSCGLDLGNRSGGAPAWCLAAGRLHPRVKLWGPLAVALSHLAPGRNLAQLVRQPDMLQSLFKETSARRPEGAVLDLTVCADGREPLALNVMLAGRDLVAVETVACLLLGFSPLSAPVLNAAERAGWGSSSADDREVVGDLRPATLTRTRTALLNGRGWLIDDAPDWFGRLAHTWNRWTPAGRGSRRRFEAMPWGRMWRDPGALD